MRPPGPIQARAAGDAAPRDCYAGPGEWSAGVVGAPAELSAAAEPGEELSFGDARIEDQRFRQYEAITPLVLPAATGGRGAVTYALSPALPAGLAFDAGARTLRGAPSAASGPVTYTYTATDAGAATASLTFTVEVEMSAEEAALRRDALAAQGRALLSSVTGVLGERLRPRSGPVGGEETQGAARALGEALVSLLGLRPGREFGPGTGGAGFAPGVGLAGRAAGSGGSRNEPSAPGWPGGPGGLSGLGSDSDLGGLSGFVSHEALRGGAGSVGSWGRAVGACGLSVRAPSAAAAGELPADGVGGELAQVGLSYESSEAVRGDVRRQFTLGREQWLDRGAGYQWAVAVLNTF